MEVRPLPTWLARQTPMFARVAAWAREKGQEASEAASSGPGGGTCEALAVERRWSFRNPLLLLDTLPWSFPPNRRRKRPPKWREVRAAFLPGEESYVNAEAVLRDEM